MIYFKNVNFKTRDFSPIMKWVLGGVNCVILQYVSPIFEGYYFIIGDAYFLMKCLLLIGHTVLQGQSLINAST